MLGFVLLVFPAFGSGYGVRLSGIRFCAQDRAQDTLPVRGRRLIVSKAKEKGWALAGLA